MAQQTDRPTIYKQSYRTTPNYISHGAGEDKLAILVCRIKVWKVKTEKDQNNKTIYKWFDVPDNNNCMIVREVESIEISNSYKEIINKAVLTFPRGTLIEKSKQVVAVDSGNNDGTLVGKLASQATQYGDFVSGENLIAVDMDKNIAAKANKLLNGKGIQIKPIGTLTTVDGTAVDAGLTALNSHLTEKDLLTTTDFSVGNRIEIYLGYAYSEEEFNKMNSDTNKVPVNMELAFNGFITKCSASTPLEVECENMAHILTTINVPDIKIKGKTTLKDFLNDNGKYHILKGTGISVGNYTENETIEIANVHIGSQLNVADVLKEWQKAGIMSYIEDIYENGQYKSYLRVGRTYYAGLGGGKMPTKDKKYITYNKSESYNIIQFDWDVADDRLQLMSTDKNYLAVNATGRDKDNKWFKFTLRKNSIQSEDFAASNDESQWSIVNETKIVKKKARKKKDGTYGKRPKGTATQKDKANQADLSNYTVIPYISQTVPCTKDQLVKEAKQYWTNYVPNGISGSISIFGDLEVHPTDIVGLIDPRNPLKNGYYMVESVDIKFGVDGYRKELKLPYKIAKFNDIPVYITRQ